MEKSQNILEQLQLKPFNPVFPFRDSWWQTVLGSFWPQRPGLKSSTAHHITLDDGDQLVLLENRPSTWKHGDRIILLVHGLGGDSFSPYMNRLSRKLFEQGFLVQRLNFRGCGPGKALAANPYHSGRSEDTRAVQKWLAEKYPGSPVTQLSFSLGANVTLKMAGEDGSIPTGGLDSVIAISPPINLLAYPPHLEKNIKHKFFDWYLVNEIRKEINLLKTHHAHLKPYKISRRMRLTDIDAHYTAPLGGFKSAEDYYIKASSFPLLGNISVPTLILYAEDDPVVPPEDFARIPENSNIDLVITKHGGHVGFIGSSGRGFPNYRWMDELILKWIATLKDSKALPRLNTVNGFDTSST